LGDKYLAILASRELLLHFLNMWCKDKKVNQPHYRPEVTRGFQEVKIPRMVVRLSALRTGRILPSGNTPGTHFCQRLSRPHGHSVFGRFMSMKNSNDTIWNRTSDLPICSTAL